MNASRVPIINKEKLNSCCFISTSFSAFYNQMCAVVGRAKTVETA